MSVNILRYFEGQEIRDARQETADLKLLVTIAKREQAAAEEQLRAKLKEVTKEAPRLPIAGALTWRRGPRDG